MNGLIIFYSYISFNNDNRRTQTKQSIQELYFIKYSFYFVSIYLHFLHFVVLIHRLPIV